MPIDALAFGVYIVRVDKASFVRMGRVPNGIMGLHFAAASSGLRTNPLPRHQMFMP